jgi:ketosteroid isomerase-like protein
VANLTHDDALRLMEAAFASLIDRQEPVEALSRFYAQDCVQEVDGEWMAYPQFLDHARRIKASIRSAQVRFEALAVDGAAIAAIYRVESLSQNGEAGTLKVIAFLTVADGKIASVKELTHILRQDVVARPPPFTPIASSGPALSRGAALAVLEGAFACLLDPREPAASLDRYFSPSYVQEVDGARMDYGHFLDHAQTLKAALRSASARVDTLVVDGSTIADIHLVEAEKTDGGRLATRVFAFFVVEDGKIVGVNELTRLVHGDAADRDLGSRRSGA